MTRLRIDDLLNLLFVYRWWKRQIVLLVNMCLCSLVIGRNSAFSVGIVGAIGAVRGTAVVVVEVSMA